MNDPRYEAIIRGATETRVIEFKAAMDWRIASKCAKCEIFRDIAAMANVGGGHIVIGRDEPAFTSGSLTYDQMVSFDPTPLNIDVHNYLSPATECRVAVQNVDGDTVVILDIPGFETSPLIFHKVGNCGNSGCKVPHFRPGDVFIRTKAAQSRRIENAEEMRELLGLAVRKSRDELVTALQRMLASPASTEEPLAESAYDPETEHEQRDFFGPIFYPWLTTSGHFDMVVRPVDYRSDRIDLHQVPRRIVEYAAIISRAGIVDAVPFEQNHDQENFVTGARLRLVKPEWRRVEAVSLHTSGNYRIVRAFQEDYEPNSDRSAAQIVQTHRTLLIDTFIEQMTLLHILARNIARSLLADPDDEVQIDLKVDGMAGRALEANRLDPLRTFLLGIPGHTGTENIFNFPLRTTLRALEVEAVSLARERCARILWTFGLRGDAVLPIQRALLGNTERIALPPPP